MLKELTEHSGGLRESDRREYAAAVFSAARGGTIGSQIEADQHFVRLGRLGKSLTDFRNDVEIAKRYIVAEAAQQTQVERRQRRDTAIQNLNAHQVANRGVYEEAKRLQQIADRLKDEADEFANDEHGARAIRDSAQHLFV